MVISPQDAAAAPPLLPRRDWQFHLKHIFALTTIAAIASALVAAYGPGTLLTSAGMCVAWLNRCGAFERLQSGRRQDVVLWVAWAMFLVSLGLPSVKVFGPVYGGWAAWFALTGPIREIFRDEAWKPGLAIYVVIDLANLLLLLAPILIWRLRHGGGQRWSAALCLTMPGPWTVARSEGMLVGYYVWSLSFLLALLAIRVDQWTLTAMALVAIAVAIVFR